MASIEDKVRDVTGAGTGLVKDRVWHYVTDKLKELGGAALLGGYAYVASNGSLLAAAGGVGLGYLLMKVFTFIPDVYKTVKDYWTAGKKAVGKDDSEKKSDSTHASPHPT